MSMKKTSIRRPADEKLLTYKHDARASESETHLLALRAGIISTAARIRLAGLLAIILLSQFVGPIRTRVAAEEPDRSAAASRNWALLIGVENYQKASRLRYTINDVVEIGYSLVYRGNFEEKHVVRIHDNVQGTALRPTKANLLAQIPAFMRKPGPEDQIVVYFSGHGFRDKDGKLYLAPIDCDPLDPAATAVPVAWLRQQLASCKAGFKLLVLDSCHAGSEKSASVASRDLGEAFRDLLGVATIASSKADEKSQIWTEKEQSLFSYWFNQGLKGHADKDGDGQVTLDELFRFVYRKVKFTAGHQFKLPQTPVRIVRSGTLGVPVVMKLKPQSLKQVLADMAEQLAWSLTTHELAKVGVFEFTVGRFGAETLGADFGALGNYCAEEIHQHLVDLAPEGNFQVVDRRRLQSALRKQSFSIADLASTKSLERLSRNTNGLPAVVVGTISGRKGRVIHLKAELVHTDAEIASESAGGTAVLNESEWAMLGRSVAVELTDRRPEVDPVTSRIERPVADSLVERLDRRSQLPNPMLDPSFPFRVRIFVDGYERKARPGRGEDRNNMYVGLRKGEVYKIKIEYLDVNNNSDQIVFLRLLVDGCNTLPEKVTTKGIEVWEWGKRVNLAEAHKWLLDPSQRRRWDVRGFYTKTGEDGAYKEFTVVDAQQSIAARQQFTDQIGLITAAFYAPAGRGRTALGTTGGDERNQHVERYKGDKKIGNLIAVVHLRYVTPEALP